MVDYVKKLLMLLLKRYDYILSILDMVMTFDTYYLIFFFLLLVGGVFFCIWKSSVILGCFIFSGYFFYFSGF